MEAGQKPCLFLSHSGIDSDAGRELKRRILATEAAKQAGLEVWFDKDDLVPGLDDWQKQLEIALTRKATAFAVLVGSKGVVNWVEREVRIGLSRATGDGAIPFVAVLAKDAPGVSALPPFAQQHQSVNDPLNNEVELQRLLAAVLSRKPTETPLLSEPFVGLRSMREGDAGRFFGRDDEIAELVGALKRHRLLAIVADSGAGKSSLAMAGLVPAFRGGAFADPAGRGPDNRAWHVVVMRPGDNPLEGIRRGLTEAAERMQIAPSERAALRQRLSFDNLSESAYALRCDLPAAEAETLLVVDQFEELLTETPEHLRAPFVDFLVNLAALREPGGFRVLLTVRADYFNLCKPFPELYDLLAAAHDPATLRLQRISDKGLMEAVRKPLELAGYRKREDTERLATRTQRDLSDRPGDLALAQMALYVVWRRRVSPDGTLIDAYTDVGGVTGALAQEAERVRTERLTKEEAALLAPLFVRLIRLGDTGGAIRRICLRTELDPARLELADKLCSDEFGRLLLAGDDEFDVCHEALITQWPWLQDELHRSAGDLRDFEPLMRRASAWSAAPDADKGEHLATGVERAAFSALASRRDSWLSQAERDFVAASDKAWRDELDAREQQRQAQARALTFRKWTTRAAIAASIVFAALAVFGGWAALEARRQQEIAQIEAARANAAIAVADLAAKVATLNETISLAALSRAALAEHRPADAVELALASWPRRGDEARPSLDRSRLALSAALAAMREHRRLTGHENQVSAAAFSPDGGRVVTGSWDGTIRIWDVSTGREIARYDDDGSQILSAGFSPDGTRIFAASFNDTRILDASNGRQVIRLKGGKFGAFSPDGSRVVTGATSGVAVVWDIATGDVVAGLTGYGGSSPTAAFSPDGARIVTSSSSDKTVRIWDVASGTEVGRLEGHEDDVLDVVFSPDGDRIATASRDRTARIWDAATGREIRRLVGHEADVTSVAFSPDGARVVSGSFDKTARIWDAATGVEIGRLVGHENLVTAARFSPDGRLVVTSSADKTARIWDMSVGRETARLGIADGSIWSVAMAPDRKRIVVTGYYDSAVAKTDDSRATIWDVESGEVVGVLTGHKGMIWSVGFSPDGTRIVSSSSDKTARIWDAGTQREIAQLVGHDDSVFLASFSPDGKRVVTGSGDSTVRIWDAVTGLELTRLTGHAGSVWSAAFSPDGTRVVSGSSDKTARIWDVGAGREIARAVGHDAVIYGVAFSPDGTHVVTASEDKTAGLWDAATGRQLTRMIGHENWLSSVAFSPDGSRIVTGSADGTARIWDVATGGEVARLTGHQSAARSVAFASDGLHVLTGAGDGTARIWDISALEKGDAFQIACQRLGNNTELAEVIGRYGLGQLKPICGENSPLPLDWSALQ